ncbi:MAG TPA: hypothetical protein VFQ59_02365 [Candidatus Paceibacterota bacterium]|nr:hypothetical protein [Candidatus Paceibacterota bacterium]
MPEIIPAVLPKNYEDMKNKVALVRGFAPIVQIDICDGVFVKNTTWPFAGGKLDYHFEKIQREEEGMPFWEDIDFELDLMVSDAVENFDIYTKLGPKRMVFHLKAVGDVEVFNEFLEGIDPYIKETISMGVAVSLDTPIEDAFRVANNADFIQVMGIARPGFQGESFDERALSYVSSLKEKFPDLIVSVDGGVNFDCAPEILDAGADRLVAGSAIFNTDDIIGTIEEFKNL